MATPESLFEARLAADPSRPLLTFYDQATGERAELSAKSVGNWVAKTHFLLLDELGLGVGDRAYVSLPTHWMIAPVLLGCWFAGLEVTSGPAGAAFGDFGSGAAVAFGDFGSGAAFGDFGSGAAFGDFGSEAALPPGRPDLAAIDDVYAVSLLSMARSAEPPPGMSDYAAAVRPQPDSWAAVRAQAGPGAAALDGASRSELADRAAELARELGLGRGGRLLWDAEGFDAADWVAAVLAPLAVGGSVVLVRHPLADKRAALIEAEQITATLAM